jgi:hypothetical protein
MRAIGVPFCLAVLAALGLSACGTVVPQIGEIWDDDTGIHSSTIETKIKEKIYCELERAVSDINTNQVIEIVGPDPKHKGQKALIKRKPVPETWGATLTLTLTVEEMSSANPAEALTEPIAHVGAPTFGLGIGGTLSSDATRVDKFTFFYPVKDLEGNSPDCLPKKSDSDRGLDMSALHGSSLLLESDLGIEPWLINAAHVRASTGESSKSAQEVLSYDVKFDIVSSGNITPSWKLKRVSVDTGSSPLFASKRERTHDMLITFGPTTTSPNGKSVPGTLATNDALAAQIGASVGAAVKAALGSGPN